MFPFDPDNEEGYTFIDESEIEFMKKMKMKQSAEEYDEETLENLISWISMVRFESALIEMIMSGLVVGDWDNEEDEPIVILTEEFDDAGKALDKKSVNLFLDDLFGKH